MLKVVHFVISKLKKIVSFLLFLVCCYFLLSILTEKNISIDCPILKITGFYCPGCGISRLILSLFKGNIYQAFRWNPFLFLLIICLPIYVFIEDKIPKKVQTILLYSLLVITITYMVIRNIPFFEYLKPTRV